MYSGEPRRDPSNRRLYEHGIWYLFDTARNPTRNLLRPKCVPIPSRQQWRTTEKSTESPKELTKMTQNRQKLCKIDKNPHKYQQKITQLSYTVPHQGSECLGNIYLPLWKHKGRIVRARKPAPPWNFYRSSLHHPPHLCRYSSVSIACPTIPQI